MPTALTPTVNSSWRLDVDTTPLTTATWVQVLAANKIAPTVNSTVQDATDYDSAGWGSDAVTLRKWQIAADLLRKVTATDVYDVGQEFLRVASENLDLVHIRWYDRSNANGEAFEGWALVQWTPAGGTAEGLQLVNVVLLGQGARTAITNPTTAAVVPTITSALPSGAAAGALVTIKGTAFTGVVGVAGVKFAAVNATNYTVLDNYTIVATMPAGGAGSAPITVTNGVGTSAAFAYTRA